jgi:hypothetical protein
LRLLVLDEVTPHDQNGEIWPTAAIVRGLAACAAVVLFVLGAPRSAFAANVCDPDGHFCIVLDTASALVCDTSPHAPPGSQTCEREDRELQSAARSVQHLRPDEHVVAAMVARFDDWRVNVLVTRSPLAPEMAGEAELAGFSAGLVAGLNASLRSMGWLVEESAPPQMLRVRGIQVLRTQAKGVTSGIGGLMYLQSVRYEVRAQTSTYVVTLASTDEDPSRVARFGDTLIQSVDAMAQHPVDADETSKWVARLVLAAGALVALAFGLRARAARRGKRAIEPRDLWPH